jgi:type IX secretion system PorP/SprF family membrane protein
LNAGFYGEFQESFFIGLSAPDMVRARIDDVQVADQGEDAFLQYFTFLLGYKFDVTNYDMKIEPSIFMKRLRNLDFQVDVNARFSFLSDQLIGGLTYTIGSGDRLGFIIGTKLDSFRFYYAYDASFAELQDYAGGSHEITLGVSWPRRVQ